MKDALLWTGDKKLKNALKLKGFDRFYDIYNRKRFRKCQPSKPTLLKMFFNLLSFYPPSVFSL